MEKLDIAKCDFKLGFRKLFLPLFDIRNG